MNKLDTGDTYPSMSVDLVSGGSVTLPDGLSSTYQIILFYRGHW
ncbi:MAG: hypothetical protein AB8B48_18525 [Pseudomonadales bacterium]